MSEMQKPGIVLAVAGISGIVISFIIQKGEFDPLSLGISFASILLAIMGFAWILGSPGEKEAGRNKRRRRKRPS